MTGLVVSNQRGGVGKTTTAVNFAGYLARQKKRVLLIDADSQGSINTYMGLRPEKFIANLIVNKDPLAHCVTKHSEYIDVLCSNRETAQAEAALLGQVAREMALKLLLKPAEGLYDYVLVDVAPSITLLQTCALVFARHLVVPLDMDMLSLQGAQMAVESARMLNDIYGLDIRVIGFLPTQVNHRHQVTGVVRSALEFISNKTAITILPEIRTDQTVHKAARAKEFLYDYDSRCKATEDYELAFAAMVKALEVSRVPAAQTA
jgi:chromosome partitioning protein